MRIKADQLHGSLKKGLSPIYAVSGDDPLLTDEACGEIRAALRSADVVEREVFQAERDFDWSAWLANFDCLSLFASRRLVELRLPTGKPGTEGGKAIEAWCSNPPPDTWLLITLPKLDRAGQASKWFGTLEKHGVVVTVTPPTLDQLPAWIGQRLARHGLKADRETLAFLTARVEGNLLAAHQEIEKLALLLPPGPLPMATAQEAVLDVARYDASQIPDALLKGEAGRVVRILDGLRAEGESPVLAAWMLTQEIRTLYRIASSMRRGESPGVVMSRLRIWDSRQPLVGRAVKRIGLSRLQAAMLQAARIDRAAKGLLREDAWEMLKQLALALTGRAGPMTFEEQYGY